jgi:DNA-binding GntR family transcriptional regulator
MSSISRIEFAPDLTDQVYQRLLNAICNGELGPGARLTQEELAANLDVSRQPVLQALRMLKKDGFVIDAGRRGLMVAPLGAEMISQIYQVRAVLDALAARQAALAKARIDPALITAGREAVAGSHVGSMIDADLEFHNAIYAASGNPLIAETANHHWRHIRRAMGAVLQQARVRDSVWDEHQAMIDAIARGDADRAESLAREHGEEAGKNLAMELDRHVREAS